MVVDVLTMLDPTLNSGSSRDIGGSDESEESFGAIFEERMRSESSRPDKTESKPDNTARETNQVKPKSAEKSNENEQTKSAQTQTDNKESAEEVTDEQLAAVATTDNENSADGEIELTEEQLSKLAAMMGLSLQETAKLALLLEGKSGHLITSMSDDTQNKLAQLLGTKTGGMSKDQQEAVAKLAVLLDMDMEEAETLFKQLKVISMETKSETNLTAKVMTAAQVSEMEIKSETNLTAKVMTAAQISESEMKAGEKTFNSHLDDVVKTTQSSSVNQTAEQVAADGIKTGKSVSTQGAARVDAPETVDKTMENKIIDQIVEKVKIISFPKQSYARIALKPPHLGHVDIKIVMHETTARATIVVESAAVKQMVDQNLDELKAALSQQGLSVEDMSVNVKQQDARTSDDAEQRSENGGNDSGEFIEDSGDSNMDPGQLSSEIIKAAYNSLLNIKV